MFRTKRKSEKDENLAETKKVRPDASATAVAVDTKTKPVIAQSDGGQPDSQKRRVDDTAAPRVRPPVVFQPVYDAIVECLMPAAYSDASVGLPVPPVLELIALYAQGSVNTIHIPKPHGMMREAVVCPDGRLAVSDDKSIHVSDGVGLVNFSTMFSVEKEEGALYLNSMCWDSSRAVLIVSCWTVQYEFRFYSLKDEEKPKQFELPLVLNIRDPKEYLLATASEVRRGEFQLLDICGGVIPAYRAPGSMMTTSSHAKDGPRVVYFADLWRVFRKDQSGAKPIRFEAPRDYPEIERISAIVGTPSGHMIISTYVTMATTTTTCQRGEVIYYFDPHEPTIRHLAGNHSRADDVDGHPIHEAGFLDVQSLVVHRDRQSLIVVGSFAVREIPLDSFFFTPICNAS